jgi:hypothetical protein
LTRLLIAPTLLALLSAAYGGCVLGDHDFSGYQREPASGEGQNDSDEASAHCVPGTCAAVEAECGVVSDGCGKSIDCGRCAGGEVCGPDRRCGPKPCQPKTCKELGHRCGNASDGCGGEIDCGQCSAPDVCIEGLYNFCLCQAFTCAAMHAQCGELEDGCGGEIDCGECGPKHECEDNRCVKEEDDD